MASHRKETGGDSTVDEEGLFFHGVLESEVSGLWNLLAGNGAKSN